jgi:hypothetical protein
LSKKVTRLPGDEPPPDVERGRRVLALRPKRTVDTWKVSDETGRVVVTHVKAFGRLEAKLARMLRASPTINRPLDEFGSRIWMMCDGEHTLEEIARALEAEFHERFEPAFPRTLKFVEILAQRRLVTIVREGESG